MNKDKSGVLALVTTTITVTVTVSTENVPQLDLGITQPPRRSIKFKVDPPGSTGNIDSHMSRY